MSKGWGGLPVVIFGTGGCAREISLLINDINNSNYSPVYNFLGYVSNQEKDIGKIIDGYPVVSSNDSIPSLINKYPIIGACLGLGNPNDKKNLDYFLSSFNNVIFPNLIHPQAHIPRNASIQFGNGIVICSGANITTNVSIGNHVLLNRNCNVGHDSSIGDYCTINPGAVISGNVKIDELTLIGAGSTIREKTSVGYSSIVGMGAIVVKNVEPCSTVISEAAKRMN